MAMTVVLGNATGATPDWADVTAAKWNRVDSISGTTAIPTPTATGTNFSFIKTFSIDIDTTDSLTMTDIAVGKVANEATTGTKLWHYTGHAEGEYTQATAVPTATGDNNTTAPTLNGQTGVAMPLIGSASPYSAGPHTTTGRKGNIVEIALGVDATNTTGGGAVDTPTVRWQWTEG